MEQLVQSSSAAPISEYDAYVRAEWDLFQRDPSRRRASIEAVRDLHPRRVLDIGCGAGQELLSFVADRRAFGLGIDISKEAGLAGRQLFAAQGLDDRVAFARASAESVPCRSGSFDVIICRLALPYTDNHKVFAEFARILRPGGMILVKIHHPRFYLRKFTDGFRSGDVRSMVHSIRVLTAGTLYIVLGRQIRNGIVGRECFQTERLLRQELRRHSLSIVRRMPDYTPPTPSFVVVKREA